MPKPMVVLADPDYAYLAPLELKLIEDLGDEIDLEVITEEAYLDAFLLLPHDIETLVVCEEWASRGIERQNIEATLVLVEEREADNTGSLDAESIFKYSSLPLIFGKLMSMSPRLRTQSADAGARICTVYSPQGGSGKTTVALGLAAALRGAYKRVLYVDAECLQTFGCRFKTERFAPADMVRGLRQHTGDAYDTLKDFIESDLIDCLPALKTGLGAYGVELGAYRRLAEDARDSGDYDYVIVDTDSSFDAEKLALFQISDVVAIPVVADVEATAKIERFRSSIDAADKERYRFFLNNRRPASGKAAPDAGLPVELDGVIEFVEGLEQMDASQYGSVPSFVRLAEALV